MIDLSTYSLVAGGCSLGDRAPHEQGLRMDRKNIRLVATICLKTLVAIIIVTVMIVNLKSRTPRKNTEMTNESNSEGTDYERPDPTRDPNTYSPLKTEHGGSWDNLDKFFKIQSSNANKQNTQGDTKSGSDNSDLYIDETTERTGNNAGFSDLEAGKNPDIEVTIEVVDESGSLASETGTANQATDSPSVVENNDNQNSGVKTEQPERTGDSLDSGIVHASNNNDHKLPNRTFTGDEFSSDKHREDYIPDGDSEDDDNEESGSGHPGKEASDTNDVESQDTDQYKQFLSPEVNNCAQWMNCQSKYLEKYISNFQKLPSCPCTYPKTLEINNQIWDSNKKQFYEWQDASNEKEALQVYRRGASFCIRSKLIPGRVDFMAQNCCYDNQLRLITRGPGAGTPDLVSPVISRALHYKVDKLPWIICKGDWTRYNQVRPPNNVRQCPEFPDTTTFYRLVKEARDF